MKRKFISLILISVMLLSSLCLTSCNKGEKVTGINGKTPAEAFEAAKTALADVPQHIVEMDLELELKFFSISLIELEDFCVYTYKGENESHVISDEALATMAEYNMEDVLSGFKEATWYVDGVCYVKDDGKKTKYEAKSSPIADSEYEEAIAEIISENAGSIQCYLKDEQYYFELVIKDENQMKLGMGASKEVYRIYFTSDGKIDSLEVECTVASLGLIKISADYEYDEVPDITPPADAENYVEKNKK